MDEVRYEGKGERTQFLVRGESDMPQKQEVQNFAREGGPP